VAIARRGGKGTLVLTTKSGHFIHGSEPELVVWAIRRVIAMAKPHPELDRFVGQYAFTPAFAIAITRDDDSLAPVVAEVLRRIDGEAPRGDVPLDVRGTAFQARVWQELQRIPRGETRSYGDVAAAVGVPGGARAVGAACGSNPVGVVVPCHRVITAAGALGGYAWGLDAKQALLERERAT